MGWTTIQARYGEDAYPIGRFILDRARALGISRTELVGRLGYRHVGNGHRALAEMLTTGTVPPLIAQHLADALRVDEAIVAAVISATARQQRDEDLNALSPERLYTGRRSSHICAAKPSGKYLNPFLSRRC